MKLHMSIECRDREDMDRQITERVDQFFGLQPGYDPKRVYVTVSEITVRPNPNPERGSWSHLQWLAEFDVEAPG